MQLGLILVVVHSSSTQQQAPRTSNCNCPQKMDFLSVATLAAAPNARLSKILAQARREFECSLTTLVTRSSQVVDRISPKDGLRRRKKVRGAYLYFNLLASTSTNLLFLCVKVNKGKNSARASAAARTAAIMDGDVNVSKQEEKEVRMHMHNLIIK